MNTFKQPSSSGKFLAAPRSGKAFLCLSSKPEQEYIATVQGLQEMGRNALPATHALLKEALKSHSKSVTLNSYMAITKELQGDKEEAFSFWLKVASLEPQNPDNHFALAIRYQERGAFQKALDSYSIAIYRVLGEKQTFYSYLYNARGKLYEQMGQDGLAEFDFDRAATLKRQMNQLAKNPARSSEPI